MSDSDIELDIQPVSKFDPAELMAKMGYVPGQGLGAGNQGITEPLGVAHRPKRAGLGSTTEAGPGNKAEEQLEGEFKNVLHIQDEINGLKGALAALDAPILDIPEYAQFSRLESWDDLEMWHAIQHSVQIELNQCRTSDKVGLGLEYAQSCLPRSHYIQLLKQWVDKAEPQDVAFLITHKSLFAPVMGIAARQLGPHLLDSGDLELVLGIPQFSSAIAEHIAHHQHANIDGVARYLDQTHNYQVLRITGDFPDQLAQADKFSKYPGHFRSILTLYILPAWIRFVRTNITWIDHETLQMQIDQLRSRGVDNEPIHYVLEMINGYLDTGDLPQLVSFNAVISVFCQLRNYNYIRTGEESGTIEGKVDWFVTGDELYTTCSEITGPTQIDTLTMQVRGTKGQAA